MKIWSSTSEFVIKFGVGLIVWEGVIRWGIRVFIDGKGENLWDVHYLAECIECTVR